MATVDPPGEIESTASATTVTLLLGLLSTLSIVFFLIWAFFRLFACWEAPDGVGDLICRLDIFFFLSLLCALTVFAFALVRWSKKLGTFKNDRAYLTTSAVLLAFLWTFLYAPVLFPFFLH
jgi:hypothetical protein